MVVTVLAMTEKRPIHNPHYVLCYNNWRSIDYLVRIFTFNRRDVNEGNVATNLSCEVSKSQKMCIEYEAHLPNQYPVYIHLPTCFDLCNIHDLWLWELRVHESMKGQEKLEPVSINVWLLSNRVSDCYKRVLYIENQSAHLPRFVESIVFRKSYTCSGS